MGRAFHKIGRKRLLRILSALAVFGAVVFGASLSVGLYGHRFLQAEFEKLLPRI